MRDLVGKSDQDLARLIANAVHVLASSGGRHTAAEQCISDAIGELERRAAADTKKRGILAAFGYHVGHVEPVDEKRRRAVLVYLLTHPLPRIREADYLLTFGEPGSQQRQQRIADLLRWFIDKHADDPRLARARAEWGTDLQFVLECDLSADHAPRTATRADFGS